MSEPHTVCQEVCSRSICSYKDSDEPDCFAKLPKFAVTSVETKNC